MIAGAAPARRIIVLDDGETWEELGDHSNAMVLTVSDVEVQQLVDGVHFDTVLGARKGMRIAWMTDATEEAEAFVASFESLLPPVS